MLLGTAASETTKISSSVMVGNQERSRNHFMLSKQTGFDLSDASILCLLSMKNSSLCSFNLFGLVKYLGEFL